VCREIDETFPVFLATSWDPERRKIVVIVVFDELHLHSPDENQDLVPVGRRKDTALAEKNNHRQNPETSLPPPNWVNQKWADDEQMKIDA
jgi:hypothetical protein